MNCWRCLPILLFTLNLVIGMRISYDGVYRYRHVARVMYDGSNFKGWQEQAGSGLRTVQGVISHRLSRRFCASVHATGSSRTDCGVHSRGQAIHFDATEILDGSSFQYNINRMLPEDIRLYNITIAPPGNAEQVLINEPWHATKSAKSKLYSYRFCTNQFVDPIKRQYCAHIFWPLDLTALNDCLQLFVGTHDFVSFTNKVDRYKKLFETKAVEFSTIKTVESIKLVDEGCGYFRAEIRLNSALYKMVRNIMGTAFDIGRGRYPLNRVAELLETSPPRTINRSDSAPPQGLCLEHVYYDHY